MPDAQPCQRSGAPLKCAPVLRRLFRLLLASIVVVVVAASGEVHGAADDQLVEAAPAVSLPESVRVFEVSSCPAAACLQCARRDTPPRQPLLAFELVAARAPTAPNPDHLVTSRILVPRRSLPSHHGDGDGPRTP